MKNFLPSRLRELRGSISQSDFANKIGVKQTSYSSWERGVKDPAAQTLGLIASTFGVSSDWLLGLPERGESSVNAPQNSGAIAVGAGAKATVGASGRHGVPTLPDCAKCKYKKFSEAFKAIQTPD